MAEQIVRIAARGEGASESGRHVAFAVPGDTLLEDGSVVPGPHHQVPPCRHFPECGGCQLQHADDEAYRGYLVSRIGMRWRNMAWRRRSAHRICPRPTAAAAPACAL